MVWRGNPLAEIPKPDVMEAKVYVLEADAGGLRVGAPASVTLPTTAQTIAISSPQSKSDPERPGGWWPRAVSASSIRVEPNSSMSRRRSRRILPRPV